MCERHLTNRSLSYALSAFQGFGNANVPTQGVALGFNMAAPSGLKTEPSLDQNTTSPPATRAFSPLLGGFSRRAGIRPNTV
jgi:hypothetical protein